MTALLISWETGRITSPPQATPINGLIVRPRWLDNVILESIRTTRRCHAIGNGGRTIDLKNSRDIVLNTAVNSRCTSEWGAVTSVSTDALRAFRATRTFLCFDLLLVSKGQIFALSIRRFRNDSQRPAAARNSLLVIFAVCTDNFPVMVLPKGSAGNAGSQPPPTRDDDV